MTAQPGRYVSLFPSERLLAGFMGQPPFLFCGGSTDVTVTGYGTLGESQTQPNGRPFDTADFTNQMKVGFRAFRRVQDNNGIPDRDDAARIHRAMFPGLPDLIPLVSRDFDEVVESLRADFAVSIAVRLSALPPTSVLRKYTSADHQIPLVGVQNGKSRSQDPMHPPALKWPGHMVPLTQVERAAKAIENGLVLAWKVPIGGWTQAALSTVALRDRIGNLRGEVGALETQLRNKEARLVQTRAELAACRAQNPGDCGPLVDAAKHAGWTGGMEAIKRDADRRIADGPPDGG